ncbi:hypothetical protein OG226_01215 [Streptomyces sp. NBC_01261]|uniref:hypothetical protein n=1 Tax=Streptomyces sp. NBC_01261 TaxID=2903802 RepID=UPI002E35BD0B|nr:hypothetical protein [Streptomyces sp. NBC_01261]
MDSTTLIVIILAIAGVVTMAIYVLKGVLDQLPDVIKSAGNVRAEWHRFKRPELPPSADDREPPPAA